MIRSRTGRAPLAMLAASGLAAAALAACSASSPGSGSGSSSSPHSGGTITVAAEQWPTCLNPLTQCAASSTLWWVVLEQVMPFAMVANAGGNLIASPLLTEAPTAANGGIQQNPFRITYHIKPDAKWADGTPITSRDFAFTWRAVLNTPNAYTTAGYNEIKSISTTDPKTVVITFSQPYASWGQLFGGVYQGILEAHAFPSLENSAKPNLGHLMATSIPFSGGPWVLQSWNQQQEILIPNKNYWGHKPLLGKLVVVPATDQNTEVANLLSGQVQAIMPQTPSSSLVTEMDHAANVKEMGAKGLFDEAVWFNNAKAPLTDVQVRRALMYALDRQAVVSSVIKPIQKNAAVLNCGLISYPGVGPYCSQQPYAMYTYDPAKALSILKADGYDCSNVPAQPCSKNGQPLTLTYETTVPNTIRTSGQQILAQMAHAGGFNLQIKNYPASILFSDVAPKGQFNLIEYANGGVPDPGDTAYFGCANIPTKANGYGGGNWPQWCDKSANTLMLESDSQVNAATRAQMLEQVYQIQASQAVSAPLYVLPGNGAWRTDRVGGPLADYVGSFLGMYYNANYWYAK